MSTALIMAPIEWLWGKGAEVPSGDMGLGVNAIRTWPDIGNPDDIDYILIWGHYDVDFAEFHNLKAIFSLGAGIDHLGDLKDFRRDIPLVKLIDPLLTEEMTGYVVMNVLRFHRLDPDYRKKQQAKEWHVTFPKTCAATRIGIAGFGELGQSAAKALVELGYNVVGWSRTKKNKSNIDLFTGPSELPSFLEGLDILVNLLPLTNETKGLWNAKTLSLLPKGAHFINAGRGGSVKEEDLITALQQDRLAGAALDVFSEEPLPRDHPFWAHENVFVTPHAASLTRVESATAQIKANIERIEQSETPRGLVDLDRGY